MRRPAFANAVSLLALFIALGGTSYAVINLPAGSVGNRELKRDAVTASKIRNRSIGPAELTPDAAGRRGPRGPQGPAGTDGLPGAAGDAVGPEPWQPLPFAGAWTNYGSGFVGGAYRKDPHGRVYVRGLVTKNGGSPVSGDVIAILPPGYRPPAKQLFAVGTGGDTGQLYGRLDVLPSGVLTWLTGASGGEDDATSLDTISFWTDP
jgi:hypothetical protein